MDRFLEYASVVSSTNKEQFERTKKALADFRPLAEKLQKKLEKIADEEDNWVCISGWPLSALGSYRALATFCTYLQPLTSYVIYIMLGIQLTYISYFINLL